MTNLQTYNSIVLSLPSIDMLTLRLDPEYQSLRRTVIKISDPRSAYYTRPNDEIFLINVGQHMLNFLSAKNKIIL